MGQVKRFTGKMDAVDDFRAALAHLHAFEQSLLAGRTKLELARTLLESDEAAAIIWARAALACFERIGAARDVDEAAQVLRVWGVAGRAGDKLVARWSAHGTHTGELMGIPPTGKKVSIGGIAIDHFENGQSVELWEIFDQLGLMQQLGVIPMS